MQLTRAVLGVASTGLALLAGCDDDDARSYFRKELPEYLDSVAREVCSIKRAEAPNGPGRRICPPPPADPIYTPAPRLPGT
jgi:hypothetical protein